MPSKAAPETAAHYSILLAGGLSSRMGQDKAELLFEGDSLLQRALNLLEASGSEVILVSGREGLANSVSDIIPQTGPPGALYSCLDYLSKLGRLDGSPAILLPVDMPRVNTDQLTALLNAMPGQEACHFEGEVFPCIVRASEKLRQYLHEQFQDSHELGRGRSMRAVLKFCQSKAISKSAFPEELFSNINTPEDFKKVLSG